MAQTGEMLAFHAGGRRYGVPASGVRAIAHIPAITPVPHAPECLMGLANVRGEAMPVIALSRLLGQPDGAPRRLVLIEGAGRVALAVDRIDGVVDAEDAPEQPPIEALLADLFPERARRSGQLSRVAPADGATRRDERLALLSFAIGGQRFALPLDEVEHVLKVPDAIARLPLSDDVTIGTIDHQDSLLALLSLPALLGLARMDSAQSRILVVRIGRHRVGFLVDAVDRLIRAPASRIDAVPVALLRGETEAVIAAIYRPGGGEALVSILAANQLLRADIVERLDAARPQAATVTSIAATPTDPLLLVRVGHHQLGFPLAAIIGIERMPDRLTRLPGAPAFLAGIARLRGEACPVVSLPDHLGVQAQPSGRGAILLSTIGGALAGFIVDAVIGIVHAPADRIKAAGDLGGPATRPFERTLDLEDGTRIALILSVDALFAQVETDLLRAWKRTSAERA